MEGCLMAKKCKVCGGENKYPRQACCSLECIKKHEAEKKRKHEEKKLQNQIDSMQRKKLKDKAWSLFSRFIRLKYSDSDGICECVTCKLKKPWKEMQAGHAVSGRGGYVLFNEKIVRPQCFGCNMAAGGRYDAFVVYLVEEEKSMQFSEYADIKRESLKPNKLRKEDFEAVIEKYTKWLVENGHSVR